MEWAIFWAILTNRTVTKKTLPSTSRLFQDFADEASHSHLSLIAFFDLGLLAVRSVEQWVYGVLMEQWGGGVPCGFQLGHLNLVMSLTWSYVRTPWKIELLEELNQIPTLSDSNHIIFHRDAMEKILTSAHPILFIYQQLLLSVDFNSTESLRILSPSENGHGTENLLAEVFGHPNHLTIWLDT